MSRSQFLVKKYCPTFYELLVKRKYPRWKSLDLKMENQLESNNEVKTSFIRLLFEIEYSNNPFLKAFSDHFDKTLKYIIETIPQKEKGIWNSINGKFDNFEDWNYLNPIGELSVLKNFMISGLYDLVGIEMKFPNGQPKDFTFKQKNNGQLVLIEVVNIHIPTQMIDYSRIKEYLINKVQGKIDKETKGITDSNELNNFFILPVVWYLSVEILENEHIFFNDFNTSLGRNFGLTHNSLGFCTYVKTSNNDLIFGEASSINNINMKEALL